MTVYYQYYGIALAVLMVKIALCACICIARSANRKKKVQRYGLPENGFAITPVNLQNIEYSRLGSPTQAENHMAYEQESCPPPAYEDTQRLVMKNSPELTSHEYHNTISSANGQTMQSRY